MKLGNFNILSIIGFAIAGAAAIGSSIINEKQMDEKIDERFKERFKEETKAAEEPTSTNEE